MTSILDPSAINVPDDEDLFGDGPGFCPVCGAKGYSCREDAMLGSGGGVTIVRGVRTDEGEAPTMHKLTAKTYVNKDSTKVVAEGSADAAYLLGLEGDEISDETAKRLGLVNGDGESYSSAWAGMKVADLKDAAADRGIEISSDWKKADFVAAHEAKDAEEAAAASSAGGTSDQDEADATDGTKQANGPAEA